MSVTLIVGDVHLGKSLGMGRPGIGSHLNGRVVDQFKLLDWVLEQAIENHASSIIFTGDICEDAKPDYYLMVFFISWLKKCEHYDIDVHIIAGNHDIKRSGSHYTSVLDIIQSAEVSNTTIYKQIDTIYNGTVGFTLFPFRDRRSLNLESANQAIERLRGILQYEAEDIPDTYDKVLIGHMALEGSIIVGDELDDTNNELMCPLDMFQGYQYVWMGHVHRPQIRLKNPHLAHIGSLDLSDFGEIDHTKIVVLFDSKLPDKFREIPVPSRPLRVLKLDISYPQDTTERIVQELEKIEKSLSLKESILKIEIQLQGMETHNADRELVQKLVNQYGVHYLCNFTESRSTCVVPQEKRKDLDNTINPKAAVKMWAEDLFKTDPVLDKDLFISMSNEIIDEYQG
jgi:DNA repair protein SbcD/Mre11